MRRNKVELYVHLVWATWDRLPLIMPEMERALYRSIGDVAQSMGCRVLAINGISDHVHVLLRIPPTLSISKLVQQLKGVSSHFVNNRLHLEYRFKWMGYYGAFSVSRWDVSKIMGYINNQKTHHGIDDLLAELEDSFEYRDNPPGE
ncbi:MAG: IS200/IS605 family transposase [Chloroflexota bacterium]|nr:IS200/IS605 family transposase [Chloroflexota bacterium]